MLLFYDDNAIVINSLDDRQYVNLLWLSINIYMGSLVF